MGARSVKDWMEIIIEFERMARQVQGIAEQRDDDDLRALAARLTLCAAEIRRDSGLPAEGCPV